MKKQYISDVERKRWEDLTLDVVWIEMMSLGFSREPMETTGFPRISVDIIGDFHFKVV
jgi:hypothetical protein